jgi:hypothetical protein
MIQRCFQCRRPLVWDYSFTIRFWFGRCPECRLCVRLET